ncbi:MAG: alpha/beta hydrolase [Verrucomicrobiales bacterium]|nr:alpha/beta hydrolase [Verrucomicrobiales bacterium]
MPDISRFPLLLCASVCCCLAMGSPAAPDPAAPAHPGAERIALWPDQAPLGDGKFGKSKAAITVHPAPNGKGVGIVICPGGGYGGLVTGPEGEGIARWLNGCAITGIVLEYRLPHGNHHLPLLDVQRALRMVREQAAKWKLDPGKIGIMGFSAGGHLASSALTQFDSGNAQSSDPVEIQSCRPDFGILVYPVISMGEIGHAGSRKNLLGANPSAELIQRFSSETQVTNKTPPCFLTHAKDDTVVSVENSRKFAAALQDRKVPCEYLELPSGGHGLNGYRGPMWDAWQDAALKWLSARDILP